MRAERMKTPRIAIPVTDQKTDNYIRALCAAGMAPVRISVQTAHNETPEREEYLDFSGFRVCDFDGLLLPGGGDVNPVLYRQENRGSRSIHDDLDRLQLDVLDCFVKARKPVLGICRGIQVINVYFGGTLIQHLDSTDRHSPGEQGPDRIHGCRTAERSWLRELYGEQMKVNSYHHQAAANPGTGLIADGWCSEDGVVESMHHESLPVFAVQWHPERMCLDYAGADKADGMPVFDFFSALVKAENGY